MDIEQAFTNSFETKDGTVVYYRPIRADDAAYIKDIFEHMSSESRYQRFHQTMDSVSETRIWEEAEKIAEADPETNFGLLVFVGSETQPHSIPVAGVRYVVVDDYTVEAAMSVRDDFQNRGIGTKLMRLIADAARQNGMQKLVAELHNSNEAVWAILNKLPYPLKRSVLGEASSIEIDLTK